MCLSTHSVIISLVQEDIIEVDMLYSETHRTLTLASWLTLGSIVEVLKTVPTLENSHDDKSEGVLLLEWITEISNVTEDFEVIAEVPIVSFPYLNTTKSRWVMTVDNGLP